MKTFNEIVNPQPLIVENIHVLVPSDKINENFLTGLMDFSKKVFSWFKNPDKLKSAIDNLIGEEGKKFQGKYTPKMTKTGETVVFRTKDPADSKETMDWSLTKVADLSDGSGLFQLTGSTSQKMLQGLVKSGKVEDLAKNSVMAIVPANGYENGKPVSMKIVKNMLEGGGDYTTKTTLDAVIPGASLEQAMTSTQSEPAL